MKKLISAALSLLLCALALTSCGDGGKTASLQPHGTSESEVSEPQSSFGEWQDADGKYVPKAAPADYSGRTFTIIVRGANNGGTYQSDDFTTDGTLYGELLNNAVRDRNNKVEELYGVTLAVDKNDDINNAIANDINSQNGDYDAIMPTLPTLAKLAADDQLFDLSSTKGIDINAPWYDQNANAAFSVRGAVYFTTGDITILNKVNTPSVLFNKEMIKSYHLEDPYQLVREKRWTFDKLTEMGRAVAEVNGDDLDRNVYGMLTTYGDVFKFYGASGEKLVVKDANDMPLLSFGGARSINITQTVLEAFANGSDWMVMAEQFPGDIWVTSLAAFSDGRVLFRPSVFSATTKLRKQSEIPFGILPTPLMDKTQEDYVSYCTTGNTAGVAIPISAKDKSFSAAMIEAYSAWAKNYVTHAYYDVILYQRDARDNESEEMLDIIFGNIVYDIGECYNFGGIKSIFTNLAKAQSTDVVSAFDAIKASVESKIAELRQTLE